MSSSGLQAQLLALLRFDRAQLLELRAAPQGPTPNLTPGQRVEALVESRAPDNRALLRVEGTLVQTKLPDSIAAQMGQKIPLTVLNVAPALTFLAQPSAPPAQTGSVQVNVSDLAARISQLVDPQKPATTTAASAAPLLAAPPLDAEQLLMPLRTAIEKSGLFYESHLAQWVSGQRSKEALQAEPQAKWPMGREEVRLPQGAARGPSEAPVNSANALKKESLPAPTTPSISAAASSGSVTSEKSILGAQPHASAMLERQINTLVSQTALWQGQLWPGQEMTWEVEEHTSHEAADTEATQWHSRIKLELPRLGEVEAVLQLSGDSLRVRIVSDQDKLKLFDDERAPLQSALEARGIALRELELKFHGEGT